MLGARTHKLVAGIFCGLILAVGLESFRPALADGMQSCLERSSAIDKVIKQRALDRFFLRSNEEFVFEDVLLSEARENLIVAMGLCVAGEAMEANHILAQIEAQLLMKPEVPNEVRS